MFNNPLISDIKFAFPNHDKRIIPAHKYVLAISSPVFFAMFYGELLEKKETVDITDCDPDIFLQFLRYLYCDDVSLQNVNQAICLLYLADKYDVPSLLTKCVNFVDGAMDPLNAFAVIPHARRFRYPGLEDKCWEVIDYNARDIVLSASFLELEHDLLDRFVERSSLRIDHEVSLFRAVGKWAQGRCEEENMVVSGSSKRSLLGEHLVRNIRFSRMSPQEFSDVVIPSEILSKEEIIDVFKQLTSVSVPHDLKFPTVPRAKSDPKSISHHSLGKISLPNRMRVDLRAEQSESVLNKRKSGVLTFTVNKPVMLYGVNIIVDKARSSRISLSIFRKDETIRQINSNSFVTKPSRSEEYGEIEVFLNRPLPLTKDTCYTIETNTDATGRQTVFVWSASFLESLQKSGFRSPSNSVFCYCSGRYTESVPMNVGYKGEIIHLAYKELNDEADKRWKKSDFSNFHKLLW